MSVASILLHVDDAAAFESRLGIAVGLAKQFNAHLSALMVWPTSNPVYSQVPIGSDVMQSHREKMQEDSERFRKACEGATAAAGVSFDWQVEEGALIDRLNEHGRYFDLIVLGQYEPDGRGGGGGSAVDHVVLESGTLCLVVPYIGAPSGQFDTVLVAWNGTIESARAVKNAVPYLRRAKRIELVAINPKEQVPEGQEAMGHGIGAYLARHGIEVEMRPIYNEQGDAGDVFLTHASNVDADLVVMGAYGHTRLREKVLGGFTRHLLQHMTVPVLMLH